MKDNKIKLMSHLVAGYPTDELAFTAARALVDGGASILEVQLPFSDPSADGPAIQGACTEVLKRGYKTEDGLNFIAKLHKEFPEVSIYLMSYGSLVYTPGVENFCKKAAAAGVTGMIIPDLPFDFDEGLTAACQKNGMNNIPVAAPSMSPERLKKMATAGFPYIYAALRTGITGTETSVDKATIDFLKATGEGGSKLYGGFGISNGNQAKALADSVEAIVAGSVFVRIITENKDNSEALYKAVRAKAEELTNKKN
ncbi:tryptophan synthase, alpha chain [Treponema bryantii]|uniref:Tryptophan synthase alpha chain n=1 Tax=Treponema bryantii TaxID=163 RepID=A0A1H9HQ64_9SPIR|nr:tryptophan synthase subunit alpha [Treponema bryantii]SEQ64455.1 tryptophan synthase, alpha chain [Treponema bryantii]